MTSLDVSRSSSQRFEPMNPAPPVTNIFLTYYVINLEKQTMHSLMTVIYVMRKKKRSTYLLKQKTLVECYVMSVHLYY